MGLRGRGEWNPGNLTYLEAREGREGSKQVKRRDAFKDQPGQGWEMDRGG